jgi:hypothetical protein
MNRAGDLASQMGLARGDRLAIENLAGDAILLCPLEIANRVRKRCIGAKQLQPTGPPQ